MSPADGVDRKPSQNPDVHRDLVVVSNDPMMGRDVANLNRASKTRLDTRGIDVPTPTHDKFTLPAALAAIEAGYFLGARQSTYLKTKNGRRVCTEGLQRMIREPDERTAEQLARGASRKAQVARGPRYYNDLAAKYGIVGKGAEAALKYAAAQIGTMEQPPGSNSGPKITAWCRLTGYSDPVPWCGCFVNACIVAGGLPSGAGWIGYTPAIVARAKAGTGGWSWHTEGRRGDLALFDTPGGPTAVHVGIVERKMGAGSYQTIEGNTSSGNSGSQSNGGMVARRQRSTSGTFRIVGFARPPW